MEDPKDNFPFKWKDFGLNVASGFYDLLKNKDMVDVTLVAEDKKFYAHKAYLSVCSPYFRDLFKANPYKHPKVILKDVGHQELANILQFIYRGEVIVENDNIESFIKLAMSLKIKGLDVQPFKKFCNFFMNTQVDSVREGDNIYSRKPIEVKDLAGDKQNTCKCLKKRLLIQLDDDVREPKRKRKSLPSPPPKTDQSSVSPVPTTSSYVPLVEPMLKTPEFLNDGASNEMGNYMDKSKADVTAGLDDSNLDLNAGDDTQSEMDKTGPGISNVGELSDQVLQDPEQLRKRFDNEVIRAERVASDDEAVRIIVAAIEYLGRPYSPALSIVENRTSQTRYQLVRQHFALEQTATEIKAATYIDEVNSGAFFI